MGTTATYIPVGMDGRVDPDDSRAAITGETILISDMHASNEVGTIQDAAEIARAGTGPIRFGLGRTTTQSELEYVAEGLGSTVCTG